MSFENIISVLGLLGIGGLLGNYFRLLWERTNKAQIQKQEFKETRYKCIILLMLACFDFEKWKTSLNRPFIKNKEDLLDELKVELYNMILFASEEVLLAFNNFIEKQDKESFFNVSLAMRKDLWGGKLSKNINILQ